MSWNEDFMAANRNACWVLVGTLDSVSRNLNEEVWRTDTRRNLQDYLQVAYDKENVGLPRIQSGDL